MHDFWSFFAAVETLESLRVVASGSGTRTHVGRLVDAGDSRCDYSPQVCASHGEQWSDGVFGFCEICPGQEVAASRLPVS